MNDEDWFDKLLSGIVWSINLIWPRSWGAWEYRVSPRPENHPQIR